MKNSLKIATILALTASICGCSQESKEKWGVTHKAPDEFRVSTRAPLTVPPEYNLRPVTIIQTESMEEKTAGMSQGEKELLEKVDNTVGK